MAQAPPQITWSEESFSRFRGLSFSTRQEILKRIGYIKANPLMYQVELQDRWAGLRRFITQSWVVFYAYWPAEHTIYVEAIVPARSDRT